jgi:hypothetical protein
MVEVRMRWMRFAVASSRLVSRLLPCVLGAVAAAGGDGEKEAVVDSSER